uniref:Uncharacterized protein n=1 Tax=Ciona savignyi TaxID=51511 RepID=H2ZQC3_CIOSA
MNAERLAKLNTYLVSKGKKPKELNRNYIKKNVVNVTGKVLTKKCQNSETTFKTKPTIKKKSIANATEKTLPKKICQSIKPHQTSKILRHNNESKTVDGNIISKNVVKPKLRSPTHSSPLKKISSVSIPSTPMSSKAIMSKKLLRRSMGFSKGGKETTTPKTHAINTTRCKSKAKHSILSKSVQPVSRVRSVTYIQRSKTPAPKKRATQAER